ncbi:hypothetical protein B7463_g979, partial [Scytalidium lignicola]
MLVPVRMATSTTARQTYLNVILFVSTSTILWGLAVVAYVVFYIEFMPHIGIERTVHLQYGDGVHPYGIANLDSTLITQQAYDITLSLKLPRSPPNLAVGNFMVSLSLLSPTYAPGDLIPGPKQLVIEPPQLVAPKKEEILFHSRRPAILTYSSQLVTYSERVAALPLYVLGLRKEAETLVVPMAESVYFDKGWKNVPKFVFMELQAGQDVQVYSAVIHFTARLAGLRWFMYYQRCIAFFVGTTAFWISEMVFTLVGWLLLRSLVPKGEENNKKVIKREGDIRSEDDESSRRKIKEEEEETDEPDLSDTPRTFPSYGRSAPLRYIPQVKDEEDSEEYTLEDTAIQPLGGEADDEDDGEGANGVDVGFVGVREGRSDSGLGTSFSEGGERAGMARRRSRGGGVGS